MLRDWTQRIRKTKHFRWTSLEPSTPPFTQCGEYRKKEQKYVKTYTVGNITGKVKTTNPSTTPADSVLILACQPEIRSNTDHRDGATPRGVRQAHSHQSATCRATRSASSLLLSSRSSVSLLLWCSPPAPFVVAVSTVLLVFAARLVARCRLASSSSLRQEAINRAQPSTTPACHSAPPCTFTASVPRVFGTPKTRGSSSVKQPCVAPNALKSSVRHFQFQYP